MGADRMRLVSYVGESGFRAIDSHTTRLPSVCGKLWTLPSSGEIRYGVPLPLVRPTQIEVGSVRLASDRGTANQPPATVALMSAYMPVLSRSISTCVPLPYRFAFHFAVIPRESNAAWTTLRS